MTRREQIIIGAALAAAVYAALDFLVLSAPNPARDPALLSRQKNASEFAARAMGKIKRIMVKDQKSNFAQWQSRIESGWQNDPFIVNPKPGSMETVSGEIASKPRTAPAFAFSGYMQMEKKSFAVINGTEYTTGETIEPFGFLVTKILPDKVVLKKKSKYHTIYLKDGSS